jgi:hypothetical protein
MEKMQDQNREAFLNGCGLKPGDNAKTRFKKVLETKLLANADPEMPPKAIAIEIVPLDKTPRAVDLVRRDRIVEKEIAPLSRLNLPTAKIVADPLGLKKAHSKARARQPKSRIPVLRRITRTAIAEDLPLPIEIRQEIMAVSHVAINQIPTVKRFIPIGTKGVI